MMSQMIRKSLRKLNVLEEIFYGHTRHKRIVLLRMAMCAVLRERYLLSFPLIAYVLGRPCHTTTLTAYHKWQALDKSHHLPSDASMGEFAGKTYADVFVRVLNVMEEAMKEGGAK